MCALSQLQCVILGTAPEGKLSPLKTAKPEKDIENTCVRL